MASSSNITVRQGRPREFDSASVLDRAIAQFTAYGYHGTSISDLNRVLGLTSGSIYKAWGDKRGLFTAALDRYVDQRVQAIRTATVEAKSGRDKIAAVLDYYAQTSSGENGLIGCMVVETAVELSTAEPELAKRIAAQQARRHLQLAQFIREGQADGTVSPGIEPSTTADLLSMITRGMRVAGKSGATLERMQVLASQAMRLLD